MALYAPAPPEGSGPARGRCILVVVTDALFNLGPDKEPAENGGPAQQPIRDDQVLAIREAFAAAGIEGQEQRQQIVQSAAVRPIASLRELYAHEARRVLQRIQESAAARPRAAGASAWELREEDTWIDKL